MNLKDYKLVGNVLRKMKKMTNGVIECEATINTAIDEFCKAFKSEMPSFNETRFKSYIEKGE